MLERWLAVAGEGRTAPSLTLSVQQLQTALRWRPLPRVPVAVPPEGGTTGVSAHCPPQPPRTEHPSANQAMTWQEPKRLAGLSIIGSQLRWSLAGLGTRSLPALKVS